MITKDSLKGGAYPVGDYELKIVKCDHKEGVGKTSGKPWEKMDLKTEITSPSNLAGKPFTTSFFYDRRLGKLITEGIGANVDDFFNGDTFNRKLLFDALEDAKIKVRLGIDDKGYNQVAEIYASTPKKEESI